MDMIAYGVASLANRQEKTIRHQVLGPGVEGTYPHVEGRLDAIEKTLEGASLTTDRLAVQNAINLMKFHAKLNAIAKTSKYQMHQLVFDDLLDLSGIDPSLSSGYTHEALKGSVTSGTIVTTPIETVSVPKKVVLTVEEIVGSENVAESKPVTVASGNFGNYTVSGVTKTKGNAGVGPYSGYVGTLKIDLQAIYKINKIFIRQNTQSSNFLNYPVKLTMISPEGKQTQYSYVVSGSTEGKWIDIPEQPVRYINWYCGQPGSNQSALFIKIEAYTAPSFTSYFISRDDGETWGPIIPGELFTFSDTESANATNQLRVKAELNGKSQLLNYAITWI